MAEEIREAIYFPILWAVHLYLESRNDEVAYAMFQGDHISGGSFGAVTTRVNTRLWPP